MRIKYPDELQNEFDYLAQFVVFNGKENVIREDAPDGIKERWETVRNKMHEIRDRYMNAEIISKTDDEIIIDIPGERVIRAKNVSRSGLK